jgi:hypothetical protein
VAAEQEAILRRQVEAGQQFRKEVEAYWEACEQWADSALDAVSQEAAKKGAFKKPSRPKSGPKSRRS